MRQALMLPKQHRVVLHIPGCGDETLSFMHKAVSDLREDVSCFTSSSSSIDLRLSLSLLNDVTLHTTMALDTDRCQLADHSGIHTFPGLSLILPKRVCASVRPDNNLGGSEEEDQSARV